MFGLILVLLGSKYHACTSRLVGVINWVVFFKFFLGLYSSGAAGGYDTQHIARTGLDFIDPIAEVICASHRPGKASAPL